MLKRSYRHRIVCLVPVCIIASVFAAEKKPSPQQIDDWRAAAQVSMDKNDLPAAEAIYQSIITTKPGTWDAFDASKKKICLKIQNTRFADADRDITQFKTAFSSHQQFGMAVKEVADAYLYRAKDNARAGQLYQDILNGRSGKTEAMWAHRGLAIVHIKQGNLETAQASVDRLANDYVDQSDVGMALKEVADAYLYDAKDAFEASRLYQKVLDNKPSPYHAMWANRGMALANVKLGIMDAAETATGRLMTDFADQPMIGMALKEVADAYFYHANDLDKAGQLYQAILDNKPSDRFAMWALRGQALVAIQQGKNKEAATAVARMLTKYSHCPEISRATKEVVDQYCWSGYGPETLALSQMLQSKKLGSQSDLLALGGMAQGYAFLGQDDKVDEIVNRIATQFTKEEKAAYSVFVIGEVYYKQGEKLSSQGKEQESNRAFTRAVSIWEKNQTLSADTEHQVMLVYYSGVACHYLKQYEKAMTLFHQVVSKWPAYEKAWYAQYMLAKCCEELANENKVPLEAVKAAYQELIDKYPDSSAAELAAAKLTSL